MTSADIGHLLGYTAPVVSSLLCFTLLTIYGIHQRGRNEATNKSLLLIMMVYYVSAAVGWVNLTLYHFFPEAYVHVNALYYLSLLIVQVSFYHLIYMLTGTCSVQRFLPVHYAIPCTLVAVFFVWSLFVPFDVRLALVTSRGEVQVGYEAYSAFFTHRYELRGVYTIIYIPLGILRLLRYRREITGYSADTSRGELRWLYVLIILSLAILPLPVATLFFSKQALLSSLLPMAPMLVIVVQHAILCYNMLTVNYIIITPEKHDPKDKQTKSRQLNKSLFEAYMQEAKPYLNPLLKITDLVLPLGTNRSYLSAFINREYGMNFSRFINFCRLQELERLRHLPEHKERTGVELVLMVGFCDFRSYKRIKTEVDKMKELKPFEKY